MSKNSRLEDIKRNYLYFMPSDNVVRVIRVDHKNKTLIIHNYHSHSNENIDLDTGITVMRRAFTIAQVSRIVGRKINTIKKYESMGLLPQPKKIVMKPLGKRPYRVYSQRDIDEIIAFFDKRRSVGRPISKKHDTMSKSDIKHRLDSLQKEKLNG